MNLGLTDLITAAIFSGVIGMMIWISFFISRRFVDMEMGKLNQKGIHKVFDKIMIWLAGTGLVTAILFFLLLSSFFTEKLFSHLFAVARKSHFNFTYADFSGFCELAMILLGILIAAYTFLLPNYKKLRFVDISDKAAKNIYRRFRGIIIYSLIISICGLFAMGNDTLSYGAVLLATVYYTVELFRSRELIAQSLEIVAPVEYSCAEKLISFINNRFVIVLLGGVYFIAINESFFSKSAVPEFCIFRNIVTYIFSFYFFQLLVSRLANYVFQYVNKIESQDKISRRRDIIWICDISTIIIYFSVCCSMLSRSLLNVKFNVFQHELTTSIIIVLVTFVIYLSFRVFSSTWKIGNDARFKTFVPVISIAFNFSLLFISTMMILFVFGIPISPILTVFATIDVAIAFAIKDTLKSFVHGIILLCEKDIFVGHYVSINGLSGTVEKISLRVITLREEGGCVHIIPYSEINIVTNYSTGRYVLVETLRVTESKDVGAAMKILNEVIDDFRKNSSYKNIIVGLLDIKGLDPFSSKGEGIGIEWRLRTSSAILAIRLRYEIYHKLQEKFDEAGIRVPGGIVLYKNT